jgi:predicted phosphodiesterase
VKLRVVSDLHFEFQRDFGAGLVQEIASGDFEVLAVAGDVSNFPGLRAALTLLCERVAPRPVVYVLGNHECYGASLERAQAEVRELQGLLPNLSFLERESVLIQGHRFIGCTLWYAYSGQRQPLDASISDFEEIRGFRSLFPALAADSARFLQETISPGDIVITHHLPHPKSIAQRYAGSPFNVFFLHDLAATVEDGGAALWIHGHTHTSCDYVAGGTRVVCNPFGYAHALPGEPNPAFREHFDVEV